MKNIFTFLLLVFIGGQFLWGQPANLVWNTQSRNASESMPCGGGAEEKTASDCTHAQPDAGKYLICTFKNTPHCVFRECHHGKSSG